MMYSSPIVPALIPTSLQAVIDATTALRGIAEIHVDVVDGVFVSTSSWPYVPSGHPQAAKVYLDAFTLEVDLMVAEPLAAARAWAEAGADMVVFHVETISLEVFTQFVAETAYTVGVAASNDTPNAVLAPYALVADYVQVMGIATIGSQGQPFDERVYQRIQFLRSLRADMMISIDGSVNAATLPHLSTLRLDRYIMGSAIMGAASPCDAYDMFTAVWRSSTGRG